MSVVKSALHLRFWLRDKQLSQKWLATTLGTTQPTVYRWVTGEMRPDTHFRQAIHYLSQGQVPFQGWFYEDELMVAKIYQKESVRLQALRANTTPARKSRQNKKWWGKNSDEQKGQQQS